MKNTHPNLHPDLFIKFVEFWHGHHTDSCPIAKFLQSDRNAPNFLQNLELIVMETDDNWEDSWYAFLTI